MGKPDPKLLEMAEVFHIPMAAKMKYIILPARLPALSKLSGRKTRTTSDPVSGQPGNGREEANQR